MAEQERERDLVLNPNEYAYVLDKTKGLISCVTGSYKMSLSTSDALVTFNENSKRFEEVGYNTAIKTFVSAPENWYIVLKNPAKGNIHPVSGKANELPELEIGKKVNIPGNASFALYPGQMAKVIQGHSLHTNQYLLARVYDANIFGKEDILDEDGNPTGEKRNKYEIGQLLIIKGTDVSFYIPPTGIEVLPIEGTDCYVRDAVTLKTLEYCILNDEEGNKNYIHGAAVVFPRPDETFEVNPKTGKYIFKAIELQEISGIHVKVNKDYYDVVWKQCKEEDGTPFQQEDRIYHKTGEELFITGKDQMIYYPRPEHTIIDYDGKIVHHATAIPKGEGRYILNRKTGEIRTIKGPAMYLPDPREEVFVQRKLSKKECILWYPGNREVLEYNTGNNDTMVLASLAPSSVDCALGTAHSTVVTSDTITRGTKYTKPRTVTFDNKFDWAVRINVWTGYAVNVVSKSGQRKTIIGPQTYILDYDETLEEIDSYEDGLFLNTVYLKIDGNRIEDHFQVETKDFVCLDISVSYWTKFISEEKDKWFKIKDYVRFLMNEGRSLIRKEAKYHTIEDFYNNVDTIVKQSIFEANDENTDATRIFNENGLYICNIDVLDLKFKDENIKQLFDQHQSKIVSQTLELSNLEKEVVLIEGLTKAEKTKANLNYDEQLYKLNLDTELGKTIVERDAEVKKQKEESEKQRKEAEKALLDITDKIRKMELSAIKEKEEQDIAFLQKRNNLDIERQKMYTDNAKKIIDSISPDLVAAMTSNANSELLSVVASAMGPYAIARDESIADVTNKLIRGTALEGLIGELFRKISIKDEIIVNEKDGNVIETNDVAKTRRKSVPSNNK